MILTIWAVGWIGLMTAMVIIVLIGGDKDMPPGWRKSDLLPSTILVAAAWPVALLIAVWCSVAYLARKIRSRSCAGVGRNGDSS